MKKKKIFVTYDVCYGVVSKRQIAGERIECMTLLGAKITAWSIKFCKDVYNIEIKRVEHEL
jgi:hypothetical protein